MTFDDFLPLVLPSCTSCPRDLVVQQVRLAAIEFCWRTSVWREDLDTLIGDGYSTEYALPLDDQTEISKLLVVKVRDGVNAATVEHEIVTPVEGRSLNAAGSERPSAWTDNRKSVFLLPTPRKASEIDIYAALKPSQTSFSFPAEVFQHHAHEIAHGALARIFSLREGDWRDLELADRENAMFNDAIGSCAIQVNRGFSRLRRSASSRYY